MRWGFPFFPPVKIVPQVVVSCGEGVGGGRGGGEIVKKNIMNHVIGFSQQTNYKKIHIVRL